MAAPSLLRDAILRLSPRGEIAIPVSLFSARTADRVKADVFSQKSCSPAGAGALASSAVHAKIPDGESGGGA
jgi:hypothetical protein